MNTVIWLLAGCIVGVVIGPIVIACLSGLIFAAKTKTEITLDQLKRAFVGAPYMQAEATEEVWQQAHVWLTVYGVRTMRDLDGFVAQKWIFQKLSVDYWLELNRGKSGFASEAKNLDPLAVCCYGARLYMCHKANLENIRASDEYRRVHS